MIGLQLTAQNKLGDKEIHVPVLAKGSLKKFQEDAIIRLVKMGYTEEEAVKLLKGQ